MLFTENFQTDHEIILRFLDVIVGGTSILSNNKIANPGFFIMAHTFMQEFVEEGFFKKEELLIKALEDNGFPLDDGPIGGIRADQVKCRDAAEHMLNASKGWQAGDEEARGEIGWASSEYTSTLRQHLERLKSRALPLLEQNISPDDEHNISEGLNKIAFEKSTKNDGNKYAKLIESLKDELRTWK